MNFSIDLRKILDFMKNQSSEAKLFHADGPTDGGTNMMKLFFCSWVRAS
jgi:hypothetical protein